MVSSNMHIFPFDIHKLTRLEFKLSENLDSSACKLVGRYQSRGRAPIIKTETEMKRFKKTKDLKKTPRPGGLPKNLLGDQSGMGRGGGGPKNR